VNILHLDENHPLLISQLAELGHTNHEDYTSSKAEIEAKIHEYDGFIIRSRFKIDEHFLAKATNLKFIGRVGAGLENIDCEFAAQLEIKLISAPEGNRNAVGEHALGMILSLFNKFNKERTTVLSLHTPQTSRTLNMVDEKFIQAFKNPFWFINTARGKSVVTHDLMEALQLGKILGAGLDVLEYEKSSFENLFNDDQMPEAFQYLIQSENVLLSPHVAGWTKESKEKLAQTIVDKFKVYFH